jgi:hypothetical protein
MVSAEEINDLYNKLLGRDYDPDKVQKLIRNKFSLSRIEKSILHSNEYKERRNVIFNFDKWVEFGERYTYILKDKEFTEPPVTSNNNLVFIDFRYLDNMEFVIRNALLRLNGTFMVTFVCGLANYDDVKILCSEISQNIKVVKLDKHVNNNIDYNKLLLSPNFWKMLDGEKILIHQFDAFILKNNVEEFLSYDYLGSPCYYKGEELIYNGGFSMRTKQVMIDLLETHKPKDISEDIFFSRNIQMNKEVSTKFAFQEEETNAFGCHQIWRVREFSHSEFYDKLKYEKSDIHKYPNLFHKFVLGIRNPYDPIKYEVKQEYFEQKELVAHLHCYDIEKFDEFYGYKIEEIVKYYFTIVTFSKGNYKGGIDNVVVLKHENRGADVGGKFVCNRYLKDIEYDYTHILCLHSKTNKGKRKEYFEPFIRDVKKVSLLIDNSIGCYTIPNIVSNQTKFSKSHFDDNWGRNEEYMLEIERYMDLEDYGKIFPEGNVYILSYKVFRELFTDIKLFNSLNASETFDYLWVKTRYKLNGDVKDVYNYYMNKSLEANNFSTKKGWRGLADCMIEHIFERLIFGVVKKFNYEIEILDNNLSYDGKDLTKFIYEKNINYINSKPITIISCHTSTDYKYKAIINNIKYLDKISDIIYIVNSEEFRGKIEKLLDKENYIINDKLTDKQIKNYLELNQDVKEFENYETAEMHWKNFGKNENRHIGYTRIYIIYYPNDNLVCQGKWYKILKTLNLNNSFILTNDSFFIINSLESFYSIIKNSYEMVGILDSNQTKYHYPDFLRYYNSECIKKIIKFYENNFDKCKTFLDVINNLEIESTYITENKMSVYKMDENYKKNLHFDDEYYEKYLENGYPIIKIKKLLFNKYQSFPRDFKPEEYKSLHIDLNHMTNNQAEQHFFKNGFFEGRPYKKNQKTVLPDYLKKYIT